MTVSDPSGNVVEYTLTIEQDAGSRHRGAGSRLHPRRRADRLLDGLQRLGPQPDPAQQAPPLVDVADHRAQGREPWLALGSPGGSTIIATVLRMLFDRIDRGMTLEEAIAAPRAWQRDTASVTAEQSFIDAYGGLLGALGHSSSRPVRRDLASEIGAATAIEFLDNGRMVAVAEPVRRGGGATGVVVPK